MTTRTAPDQFTALDRPCGMGPAPGIDSFTSMSAERGVPAPLARRNFDLPRDFLPLA